MDVVTEPVTTEEVTTEEPAEVTLSGEATVEVKEVVDPNVIDYAGLDEDLYDGHALSKDKVRTYIEDNKKEYDSIKKQRDDFQKTISSKGQVPRDIKDYYNKYENEKYSELKDNETVKGAMESLANTYKDIGLSPKQGDEIYNQMFEIFEDIGQIDTRSPEEVTKEQNKWVDTQKQALGENSDAIISGAVNFVKGFEGINESGKDKLINLMNSKEGGAEMISALYSMSRLSGKTTIPVIPHTVAGIKTDSEFAVELRAGVSEERRAEIYKQRLSVGRTDSIFKL